MGWRNEYDVRERKEIEFCTLYAEKFNHNTEDHLSRLVVAKMAQRRRAAIIVIVLALG
jgi:hypothetical protein